MPNGNYNYNNEYLNKLIEFIQKQTTSQVEQKNAVKNLQNSIDKVKEDTSNIKSKITKMLTVASVIGAILVLAWGFISFSVDGIVSSKIEEYVMEDDVSSAEKARLEKIIKDILEKEHENYETE